MLNVQVKNHRKYLFANRDQQKLFCVLKLIPSIEAKNSKPSISTAFVVDTSGSMREVVSEPKGYTGHQVKVDGKIYKEVYGAKSKMDLIVEGLKNFANSDLLSSEDRLSLIKFDDRAKVILPFTNMNNKENILNAINKIYEFSGGTQMGKGLKTAIEQFKNEHGNKKIFLFTDGQTFDEPVVEDLIDELAKNNLPVVAFGIGEEWNEDLIIKITNATQGKPFYISADTHDVGENMDSDINIHVSDVPNLIMSELKHSIKEVISNVYLNIQLIKDVGLERITRVYPTLSEVDLSVRPYPLGNIELNESSIYVLEFNLPKRSPVRMRIAVLGLTYDTYDNEGIKYQGETNPVDIIVEFTTNEAFASETDSEVMKWVQSRNVDSLINKAISESKSDPDEATKILNMAKQATQQLGNNDMTKMIDKVINELRTNKTISINSVKTIKVGAKTKTINLDKGDKNFNDQAIRKLTENKKDEEGNL